MPSDDQTLEPSSWQRAASFAARAHRHQIRKDKKTPYIAHPFRVAMVLRMVFGCEDEVAICAALLHDTIEDTATDYDDIHRRFGPEVADCVAAMTKNMILIEQEREPEYDRRLAESSWQARIVKLADVYDNGIDMPSSSMRKRCIKRCERAMALTEADDSIEPVKRAREAVSALIVSLRAQG